MEWLLEVEGLSKSFPGVKALSNVSFQLKPGEVHALIGENGAGKSTLMKILTGIYRADSGTIRLKGNAFVVENPKHAQENGISMIYQELNLIPDLTVAENIFIAHEPRKVKNLLIDESKMNRETQKLLDSLELNISSATLVADLSVAEQQMVEIAKALILKSEILILDEPTSALSEHEVQTLFSIIKRLCAQKVGIIYITHRLEELDAIVDRVTVLRDGRQIETNNWSEMSISRLISLMVGRDMSEQYPERHAKIGEVVLEARGFVNDKLKNVSIKVRSGEILGLAGLMGAGRTEFARAIFGADKILSGETFMHGEKITVKSPADAVKNKIAYISEDRKKDGLMLELEVDTNMLAASLDSYATAGLVNDALCARIVGERIEQLAIKTPSAQQLVKLLSGGNQQKVLISRWLCCNSEVYIFDEPTRGIDVGAKYEVYSLMNKVAEAGSAIIMISSDMPEILGMSDRIAVMCEGRITGALTREEATSERILRLASNI